MRNLNNDVLENILFRLPLKVASSQAKRVCKLWKTILDSKRHNEVGFLLVGHHSKESKLQLYFGEEDHLIDLNKMRQCRFDNKSHPSDILVGSCNGLVCLKKWESCMNDDEPFAICNPLTGEYIFLENLDSQDRVFEYDNPGFVSSGFGYCQSTDEYKVVRIHFRFWNWPHVQVYTVGSNEWRDVDAYIHHRFSAYGIFANSVLHWFVYGKDRKSVVAFDLEDEKFRELPLPPTEVCEQHQNLRSELKLLGGNLCWVKLNDTHVDIWAYKKKNLDSNNTRYGMEEHDQKLDYYSENSWGWVKEFHIECEQWYKPFGITKPNEVVLLRAGDLYCFDPRTQIMSKLGDDNGMGCSYIQAIPHANSCVSLKEFGDV